ncbi:hypothetical protein G9A89_012152 [Geosiphon pyriformis]|nr:hypothetical protein G9A89_012152 [Geosiphon pyriformis]
MTAKNAFSDSKSPIQSRTISKRLPAYDAATNLLANNISTANLSATATNNLSTTVTSHLSVTVLSNLSTPTSSNVISKLSYDNVKKPKIQNHPKLEINNGYLSTNLQFIRPTIRISSNYLSLLVIPEDITSNNPELDQQPTILTNNIPPVIVTNNKLLAVIFPFEFEEVTSVPLFSRAALEEKPITVMYTDWFSRHHHHMTTHGSISARIITANGATKMPIGEIDNFPIEVNSIITPIKVLVMEATQYQALVSNDWLSKNNAILDWTIQELQFSQNGQHTQVPAMCGHFKPNNAYQVLWADVDHNELPPILAWDDDNNEKERQGKKPTSRTTINAWTNNKDHYKLTPILLWDDNPKRKQRKKLTWETNNLIWTNNNEREPTPSWEEKESNKEKGKVKEKKPLPTNSQYHNNSPIADPN